VFAVLHGHTVVRATIKAMGNPRFWAPVAPKPLNQST